MPMILYSLEKTSKFGGRWILSEFCTFFQQLRNKGAFFKKKTWFGLFFN